MLNFEPKTTSDMVFSDEHTKRLLNDILTRKLSFPKNGRNTLLLYGTYGSGKTTYAKVFFDDYEKSYGGGEALVDVYTNEGGDAVTEQISRVNTVANLVSFNQSNVHYVLFDEVDNYTKVQQQRLKSLLNREDIIVIMTTNFLNKVDDGIRSRSYAIDFNASTNAFDYVERMKQIIQQNNLPLVGEDTLRQIAIQSEGDWREMCSVLEQVCRNIESEVTDTHLQVA